MWSAWLLLVALLGAAGAQQEGKGASQKKPPSADAPSGAPPGAKTPHPCETATFPVTFRQPLVSIRRHRMFVNDSDNLMMFFFS